MSRPRLLALSAMLMLTAKPAEATASETDYLPDNLGWNGLSELSDIARGLQLNVELLPVLDWSSLPPRSTVLFIYPRLEVDPLELADFLSRGGRALIADDFGSAGPLLESFGIHRAEEPPPPASDHHLDNPALPVAIRGETSHPLNAGVDRIITNHPASFRSTLPALLRFEGDLQLLVAARHGQGTLVALSDPSVLINGMLRFTGNLTLATNLLRALAPAEGNSLYLLTGEFRTSVRRDRQVPTQQQRLGSTDSTARLLTEYNGFLSTLNAFAPLAPTFRVASLVAGCLTLMALVALLPLPRRSSAGKWFRPQGAPSLDFEEQVKRSTSGAIGAALVLREELEDLLTTFLEAPGPILSVHPGWVVRRVRDQFGPTAAELTDRLLAALRQLPPSAEPGDTQRFSRFRARDLAALHDLSRQLIKALGLRTPGLVPGKAEPADESPRG